LFWEGLQLLAAPEGSVIAQNPRKLEFAATALRARAIRSSLTAFAKPDAGPASAFSCPNRGANGFPAIPKPMRRHLEISPDGRGCGEPQRIPADGQYHTAFEWVGSTAS